MFLIPTYLAPSGIHGIGVYSAQPIPAGTQIWKFVEGVDWLIPPEALARFPEPFQAQLRAYCYLDDDSGLYVLCGDNGKYMNHSFAPNCIDPPGECTVTVRDIAAGEELTCDYRMFDLDSMRDGLQEWGQVAQIAVSSGVTDPAPHLLRSLNGDPHERGTRRL